MVRNTFDPVALDIINSRLALPNESADEMVIRNADALKLEGGLRDEFLEATYGRRFIMNSPAYHILGKEGGGNPFACFVLDFGDSMRQIFQTIQEAALVHKDGGGTGFCVSTMRPEGWPVGKTNGIASGGLSFAKVQNVATETVKQGSQRRGANMLTCHVYWPDIDKFIPMKDEAGVMENFNVSVMVDELFFRAVDEDLELCLNFPVVPAVFVPGSADCSVIPEGYQYLVSDEGDWHVLDDRYVEATADDFKCIGKHVSARAVLDDISYYAWKNGEPGVLFFDKANERNPNKEYILKATNPCGEQWLARYETCVLGNIDLWKYGYKTGYFDWDQLAKDIRMGVRVLDRMIDIAVFQIPEIEAGTKNTRRIGLGPMGWHNLLLEMGIRYDSEEALMFGEAIGKFFRGVAEDESKKLADEYGPYPAYQDGMPYRRNMFVTSVQPTGTTARMAGTSFSIEPEFDWHILNKLRLSREDPNSITEFESWNGVAKRFIDAGKELPDYFVTADNVGWEWHVRHQAVFQNHLSHNAVSKTINFANQLAPSDVKAAYRMAYDLGCLGLTVYRSGSRGEQPLNPYDADCNGPACVLPEEDNGGYNGTGVYPEGRHQEDDSLTGLYLEKEEVVVSG